MMETFLDEPRRRLVFPLDFPTLAAAKHAASELAPSVGVLKVGLELFVREGHAAVRLGQELERDVFLDLKLHDIPETVERAVLGVGALGARYLTVHAAGGTVMLTRAVAAAARAPAPLTLLAVTVLTSLDAADLGALGIPGTVREHAVRMARLAWDAGVRGFVTSAAEARSLREALGPEALLVIPGIRPVRQDGGGPQASGPSGAGADDQKRVGTPAQAIRDGADLLVVGRPIRDAADPRAAADAVVAEIRRALTMEAPPPTPRLRAPAAA